MDRKVCPPRAQPAPFLFLEGEMENNGDRKDIVAVEQEVLSPGSLEIRDIEVIVAKADAKIKAMQKVWQLAIKRTTARDWVNLGGNPYMVGSGAEKIAPIFGISIYDTKSKKIFSEDSRGAYYIWEYTGKASWAGGSIEAVGTCSSRDKFFAYANGQWKDTEDIDETNIMKAAYTNLTVNLVTRLLGLRGLTWQDLGKEGIAKDNIAAVDYKKKGNSAPRPAESGQEESAGVCATCGAPIDARVKSFSIEKYFKPLCRDCQKSQEGR